MINQLITALSQELELSAEEIADTIWLALQIDQFSSEQSDPPQPPLKSGELEQPPLKGSDPPQPPLKSRELDHPETTINQSLQEQKAGIYPRNQQQTSKTSGLSLKIPDASSLREPLILARAFKPLMRRVASDHELVLDEIATVATAQKIGDKVLCFPVFKPTLEPWLDLELVIDESISMQIWRHTIKELERLLKNYGIFRDVRVWGLMTEQVKIRRGIGASSKHQSPRSPKELIDPSGRRLVLVVSDCVSSLWRDGKVTPVLELWAKQGSMAIIQMLPKWMWKRTALGKASEVRLQGLNPGVFNQNLIAQSVSLWDELDGGVKVPVFTLEPDKAGNWAQMLAGKGSIWVSGYVFKLDTIPVKNESELLNLAPDLSAEHRVQGFRVTASPMARKLAGLLASAPVITLPIVRLIQETFLKDSLQVNVAEVFLGGLLKPLSEINAETNPDYVQYGFMEGVRELLLDSVPSDYVLTVIDKVSNYVAKKLNFSLEDFAAVLKKEQPVRNSNIVEEVGYFATVTAQVLRRLGGEYVKVAEELDKHNQKINDKEQVKVKQYWLFQGNPKYYRVLDSIHDFEQMYWLVTRYTEDIAVGDGVLIWSAGKKAGIYAIGEVIEPVNILEELPDKDYWIVKNMSQPEGKRVFTNFTTKLLENPLLYEELIQDDILKNLSVISDARGTNFQVTQEQWMQVYELRKSEIESSKLRNFLAKGKWKEADEETARLMFKVADREEEEELRIEDIENFSYTDLQTIDQLWVKYSNGHFGFSVQKKIWQQLGEQVNIETERKLGERTGWFKLDEGWLDYDDYTFSLDAPKGHLPASWDCWGIDDYEVHSTCLLLSRLLGSVENKQIDYTQLGNLLAEGKWKEADEETARLMFKIADREQERWLRVEDIEQFPSSDLQTIDQLWVEYSNGRFGFSVQKQIYQSLGGTKEFNQKITEAFWHKVGLIINNEPYWSQYDNLIFNLSAPIGHLPIRYDVNTPAGIFGVIESLFSRNDLVVLEKPNNLDNLDTDVNQVELISEKEIDFTQLSFAANPEPALPIVLLLDTSGSMSGQPINALNQGLVKFQEELSQDHLASRRVEVAIITFDSSVKIIQNFVTVDQFNSPYLSATGSTETGKAIEVALNLIEHRKAVYRNSGIDYYRPWVLLITDGMPTDNWRNSAKMVREFAANKKLKFFAVGVDGADLDILSEIAPINTPPLMLRELAFTQLFQWLSYSISAVSRSIPGDQVTLPSTISWAKSNGN